MPAIDLDAIRARLATYDALCQQAEALWDARHYGEHEGLIEDTISPLESDLVEDLRALLNALDAVAQVLQPVVPSADLVICAQTLIQSHQDLIEEAKDSAQRIAVLEAALQTIVGYGERHGIGPGVFDASYTLDTVATIARRALAAPEGDDA